MAGLPLKSGADFYNLEAARMRLHNLGADPTEVGAGLIYFNTSTGLNTSQKVRLYTGSAWKTIASSEDLDVAKNEDFLALQRRVDLLSGDVDTDAIISNMKEVSAFLEGFAEDASLMDYLNTELGKKLDLTGGTITSSKYDGLIIKRASDSAGALIAFENNGGRLGLFGFEGLDKVPIVYLGTDTNSYKYLLHSGNYSDYALPKAGGTIDSGSNDVPLVLKSSGTTTWLKFTTNDGKNRYIGVGEDNTLKFQYGGASYPIIHSGNVGDYAITTKKWLKEDDDIPLNTTGMWTNHGGYLSAGWGASYKMVFLTSTDGIRVRTIHGSEDTDWKTIAFTDSDITGTAAKAKNLVDSEGKSVVYVSGNTFYIGDSIYPTTSTQILGKDIRLRYGANASFGFWLNESGNVTIGGSDLAGANAKLYVDGATFVNSIKSSNQHPTLGNAGSGGCLVIGNLNLGLELWTRSDGHSALQAHRLNGTAEAFNLFLQPLGGNVGIGTSNPTEKLHVVGNLHVTGNIIADGEVSAGGAAEEGSTSGSGAGAFHSDIIAVGATQTTIAHGLGTDDIVVSIYEKDGVSGRWSIILTDVEIVDANNIIVSFGSATTVEHKVVIMGAVA